MQTKFWLEKPMGGEDCLEDVRIDARIILKWLLTFWSRNFTFKF